MANSKLSTFVIDCQTDDLGAAATFWSQALQRGLKPAEPGDDRYRDLYVGPGEPLLMVQRVAHEGRVHLDIESEDIEAEVARLTQLGARRLEKIRTWVVMEAPTGQRFCVVRPQRAKHEPAPIRASDQHSALMRLAGHYTGQVQVHLDPQAAPDFASGELHATALFGGRWLRLEQLGQVAGKPHAGEMLLGYHNDQQQYELCWVDSFHTGSAMMWSTGPAATDGIIRVTGSYLAGPERWGWRTEFHLTGEGRFTLRAVNISPAGDEYPAITAEWTRV